MARLSLFFLHEMNDDGLADLFKNPQNFDIQNGFD